MIRVMIVDDEPFIRQGLKILINWEQYGFTVCGEAGNGKEALELLETKDFDLVITDIKMPIMSGLELIEQIWEHVSRKIGFIILSGFYEFEYARKAIKYSVNDYVLKPVQKDELIRALENFKDQHFKKIAEQKKLEDTDSLLFDRHLTNLIADRYDAEDLEYVKNCLVDASNIRFISIEYDPSDESFHEQPTEEKVKARNVLYDALKIYLGEQCCHSYMETNPNNSTYGVGFLLTKRLEEQSGLNEKEYIKKLYQRLSDMVNYKIILFIGQRVEDISRISDSYKSTAIARTFQLFSAQKDIAYYDEIESKPRTGKSHVDKEVMDDLIKAIEENNEETINEKIDCIYEHIKQLAVEPDIVKLNLDYLLFNLISLAKSLDPAFDQSEIYNMIGQGGYEKIAVRGGVKYFKKFAQEFSVYLLQMRQHAFGGVLSEIEKEITEHYMDNLSLKSLSEKYYINSAYLGQIFKRQYGCPFKDYLNNYRVDRAAELLLRSDEKIYLIASAVGFNNTDYFISKFVQIKGITPLQYRKQFMKNRKL